MAKTQVRAKQPDLQRVSKVGKAASSGGAPLNFKVPLEFRLEFKTYAAQHNKKLNQVLFEAFDALKAKDD